MDSLYWEDEGGKGKIFLINQDENYYKSRLILSEQEENILNKMPRANNRLQWLCSRYALKQLIETDTYVELKKDAYGSPFLHEMDYHISLSHNQSWAGGFVHKKKKVGFDLESFRDKILRLENKFVSKAEAAFLSEDPEIRTRELTLVWSAKESMYKLVGNKSFDFREHLIVQTAYLLNQTKTEVTIQWKNGELIHLTLCYKIQEDFVITWIIESEPGIITSTFHE